MKKTFDKDLIEEIGGKVKEMDLTHLSYLIAALERRRKVMVRIHFPVGIEVTFPGNDGEEIRGKVVKHNPKRFEVVNADGRYGVPPEMCTPVEAA